MHSQVFLSSNDDNDDHDDDNDDHDDGDNDNDNDNDDNDNDNDDNNGNNDNNDNNNDNKTFLNVVAFLLIDFFIRRFDRFSYDDDDSDSSMLFSF